MGEPEWPQAELDAKRRGDPYYEGAAVCRRKHVETHYLKPGEPRALAENCTECGARMLTACPSCGLRIRGSRYSPGVIGIFDYTPPSFCDHCGSAYPWATRTERIYELENLLEQEDIDEADMVVIQDHLQRLRDMSLDEKTERTLWEGIKRRAGSALGSESVKNVVEGLVGAAIRKQLDL